MDQKIGAGEARALSWVPDLIADLRYGARALRRSPGFTLVAVISLALGIGANTAIFGLLYGVLVQRLSIPRPGELSALAVTLDGKQYTQFSYREFVILRDTPGAPPLRAIDEANDILVESGNVRDFAPVDFVEGGYLRMLGVPPVVGRVITPDDDRKGERVVVISDALWEHFFARDPGVVGRRLSLKMQPFTVIGVMPASFRGILFNWQFAMAVPRSSAASLGTPDDRSSVNIVTRLENAGARAALGAPLDAAHHRCCLDGTPKNAADDRVSLIDASRGVPSGKNDFRDDFRLVLWLLMGGVFLVLLIACSNVGNLLLARAAAREREFAVRLSIGASRARVLRQLLAESALLTALGGIVGIGLAAWTTGLLVGALPAGVGSGAALIEFHAKPAILAFTAAVSGISVFAFGLGPALRATRGDLVSSLRDRDGASAPGRARAVDRLLVVGQVAVTLVLVCGAGLLVATLRNLRTVDPGFASDHLIGVSIETRGTALERDGIIPIHLDLLDLVRRVPGVQSAGMATRVPAFGGRNASFPYAVVGQAAPVEPTDVDLTAVTPGYFATAGTRLIGGRDFDATDTPTGARVAIVNEAFARRHFGNRSPIGSQVRIDGLNGGVTVTLIGIAQDVRFGDRRTRQDPMIYIPAMQGGTWPFLVLMIRARTDPRLLRAPIERAVQSYSQTLRLRRWNTIEQAFDDVLLRERLAAGLASLCAGLALGLAMVGLSGVVGFSVARRTREIGVRMALGARRVDVVWLVLRGSLTIVAIGAAIGVPLALGAGRALGALLYGIAATNPLLLGAAAAAMLVVGAAASALPAFRASRVDPVSSLRAD